MEKIAKVYGINGPILTLRSEQDFKMSEMVTVGDERLIGEVINVKNDGAIVQVYEDTSGLKPNTVVYGSDRQMSVMLGPGIISNIFDGIQRPLRAFEEVSGFFLTKGVQLDKLDMDKPWDVNMLIEDGQEVSPGQIIATVKETESIDHRIMIPPNISGKVTDALNSGAYNMRKPLCKVNGQEIFMYQHWPIRVKRPVSQLRVVDRPLITGQRIIDALFPIGKGGMAAIPGGFGTGKTMTQHQLAKWCDADIIVYIGCGERGNEMTSFLEDFSELRDPRTGKPLMDRTILIANTSNMPVAAREASIYSGITIAEYYRDMGYHVALMADSTSRWAEALRELSGRLEEMPAEEGFPAYLASRLSAFYERAGYVDTLNGSEGSITIIGAVSPQGADFSEPVTQNTKRFIRCFWALDRGLAYARHFPAIDWMNSYSEYLEDLEDYYVRNVGTEFLAYRRSILQVLYEENDLMEIVKLIGADVLPDSQRLILEIAKVIRIGFVQQNAYHAFDTFVPFTKMLKMMEVILHLYDRCKVLVSYGISINELKDEDIFERITAMKYNVSNDEVEKLDTYVQATDEFYKTIYDRHAPEIERE